MLWPMLFAAQHRFSFFSCTNSFLRFFVVFFFLGYQSLVKSSVVTGYDTYVQHFLFFPQSLISLFPQFSLHSSSVFSAANFFIVVLRWLTCRLPFFSFTEGSNPPVLPSAKEKKYWPEKYFVVSHKICSGFHFI